MERVFLANRSDDTVYIPAGYLYGKNELAILIANVSGQKLIQIDGHQKTAITIDYDSIRGLPFYEVKYWDRSRAFEVWVLVRTYDLTYRGKLASLPVLSSVKLETHVGM